MSATQAESSPGPTEGPGRGSSDEEREPEGRPEADRDVRDGGESPVVNETPPQTLVPPQTPRPARATRPQTPVRSEVTARAARGSSRSASSPGGGAPALAWGLRAFVVMAVLGQAVAFAVNLARAPGESGRNGRQAGLALLRVVPPRRRHRSPRPRSKGCRRSRSHGERRARDDAGHVPRDRDPVQGRPRRGGRGRRRWGASARVLHGMKVAPAYAIPPFVVSGLVTIDIPIPRNGLVAGSLQMPSGGLSWFVLPLLIAAAAGAAGGLRSGRYELISHRSVGDADRAMGGCGCSSSGWCCRSPGSWCWRRSDPARPGPTSRRSPGHPRTRRP